MNGGVAYPPLQPGVVGVPGDDRDSQVAGQLEEVLGGGGGSPEQLRVGQVEDRRHVVPQKLLAQIRQDLCKKEHKSTFHSVPDMRDEKYRSGFSQPVIFPEFSGNYPLIDPLTL